MSQTEQRDWKGLIHGALAEAEAPPPRLGDAVFYWMAYHTNPIPGSTAGMLVPYAAWIVAEPGMVVGGGMSEEDYYIDVRLLFGRPVGAQLSAEPQPGTITRRDGIEVLARPIELPPYVQAEETIADDIHTND